MNKQKWLILLSLLSVWLLLGFHDPAKQIIRFKVPEGWPKPTYNFKNNPLTVPGIDLGRRLFYDTLLSGDNTIACANCHTSFYAFTHIDHSTSHGIKGRLGKRNSPALINLAWSRFLMWDGAVNHLDVQPLAPIASHDEMGEDLNHLIAELQNSPIYPPLFYRAFGDSTITGEHLLKSLSQFMLTLVSCESKYDSIRRHEAGVKFTEEELQGYTLFKQHCNSCHTEPLFTNNEFRNNGLPEYKTTQDKGRYGITKRPSDSLLFKVPTLRNLEYSYPYMHDGRFSRFHQFMRHYTSGIVKSPTLSKELKDPVILSEEQQKQLTAFLLTLSDRNFVKNPAFAFPE